MATKYFATTCEFMLHEDDWNKGEGKLISRWDEADCMESADTIEGVLEQVNYLNCDYLPQKSVKETFENDMCGGPKYHEYGRFDTDLMVDINDEHIIKPTEEKWKQFERGEVKLYALHVTVYVHKQADLDESDVGHLSH